MWSLSPALLADLNTQYQTFKHPTRYHTALQARQDSIETPYHNQASDPIKPTAAMGCGMSKQDCQFEQGLRESGDRCQAVSLEITTEDQREVQRRELKNQRNFRGGKLVWTDAKSGGQS